MLYSTHVEGDTLPFTEPNGIGLVVWSPLAQGVLTGKYDDAVPDDSRLARFDWAKKRWHQDAILDAVRKLKPIADELGITRGQLAIAWVLRQSGVSSAITGATQVSQLEESLKAVDVSLDNAILDRIDDILAPLNAE